MKFGIYHKDCEDGTVSALILKKAIPEIELFASSYAHEWKENLDVKKGNEVIFVDICPIPEDVIALEKKGVKVTIIDHHITAYNAMREYETLHEIKFKEYHYFPNHCGATAVWDFYFKTKTPPAMLKFVEIGDLWKWDKDKDARAVNEYIKTVCRRGSLEDYEKLLSAFDEKVAKEQGKLLWTRSQNEVTYLAAKAALLNFNGEHVLSVNSQHAISELGHELAKLDSNGIGLVYHVHPEINLVKFSVRGTKGDAARKFAEKHGGGGHDKAAAFTLSIAQFVKILKASTK